MAIKKNFYRREKKRPIIDEIEKPIEEPTSPEELYGEDLVREMEQVETPGTVVESGDRND